MKRLMLLLLAGLILCLFIAGCGQKEEPKTETPAAEEPVEEVMGDSATVADTMVTKEVEATGDTAP